MRIFSLQPDPQTRKIQMTLATLVVLPIAIGAILIMQFRWNIEVQWADVEVIQAAYRGPDGEVLPTTYSPEQLQQFAGLMQGAVGESYASLVDSEGKRRWFGKKTDWSAQTRIQELRAGGIQFEVAATSSADATTSKTWSRTFPNAEEFNNNLASEASSIAKEMFDQRQTQ